MAKTITCPCGWTVTADTDDDLVSQVQKHAKDTHQQEATREEILSMARPA
jgi:predicted small metal-binding protein